MSKLSPGEVESLNQLRKVSGTGGFKMLTGTGAHASLSGYAIVANTDTVFTVFNIDGVSKTCSSWTNRHNRKGRGILACS
jgi:hypothetical protein